MSVRISASLCSQCHVAAGDESGCRDTHLAVHISHLLSKSIELARADSAPCWLGELLPSGGGDDDFTCPWRRSERVSSRRVRSAGETRRGEERAVRVVKEMRAVRAVRAVSVSVVRRKRDE